MVLSAWEAGAQPVVMGILNVTPDSFSDGGDFFSPAAALVQARRMAAEGAAIIDVGGESTRPGASPVSVQQELDRVIPVIEAISRELPVPLSIDTRKADVMREAVAAGATMINDVRALQEDGALQAAAAAAVPVCLMHMRGQPQTMQQAPHYDDVVQDIKAFLLQRVQSCEQAGIARNRIIIDPGFGFGKTVAHNLSLLKHLHEFVATGLPVLVGVSRKSLIGAVLDTPPGERLSGGIALAALALWQGCAILRVHDVKATVDAMKMMEAVKAAR